jgi:hypothetical protein
MSQLDISILMGLGGIFVIIGVGLLIWSKKEEKNYYDCLVSRTDAREFMERSPERPEPGALKTGGWITIPIGAVMILIGGAFLIWG